MKKLLLAGGGHAHIEVLRDLAARPGSGIAVTLVTPRPRLVYTGMVPGVIAGHYRLEDCAIDLEALARHANARFVTGAIFRVDAANRRVHCADGETVEYDLLSLDVGSRVAIGGAMGVEQHAVPARPMETLLKGWSDVLSRARDGKIRSVTLVGGGAAGVELALAMEHRLRRELPAATPHVRIISNTPVIVPEFSAGARRRLRLHLGRRNIGMHVSSTVAEVGPDFVRLDTGLKFSSDATFWAAGVSAPPWLASCGLATDPGGFLLVNDALQSVTDRDVFGSGDCATQEGRPHAKAGVFAVRAAPVLAANLRAAAHGGALARYVTSARYLALVSTGRKHAVGAWGQVSFQGWWAWRWKDRIDRHFVARYSEPPQHRR
jgi:pyridine nucleotide-disulfide oxidoreductase family protein